MKEIFVSWYDSQYDLIQSLKQFAIRFWFQNNARMLSYEEARLVVWHVWCQAAKTSLGIRKIKVFIIESLSDADSS